MAWNPGQYGLESPGQYGLESLGQSGLEIQANKGLTAILATPLFPYVPEFRNTRVPSWAPPMLYL